MIEQAILDGQALLPQWRDHGVAVLSILASELPLGAAMALLPAVQQAADLSTSRRARLQLGGDAAGLLDLCDERVAIWLPSDSSPAAAVLPRAVPPHEAALSETSAVEWFARELGLPVLEAHNRKLNLNLVPRRAVADSNALVALVGTGTRPRALTAIRSFLSWVEQSLPGTQIVVAGPLAEPGVDAVQLGGLGACELLAAVAGARAVVCADADSALIAQSLHKPTVCLAGPPDWCRLSTEASYLPLHGEGCTGRCPDGDCLDALAQSDFLGALPLLSPPLDRGGEANLRKIMPSIATREEIPRLLNAMGLCGVGVELGVCLGDYSCHLLRQSCLRRLVSIDRWAGDRGHNKAQERVARRLLSQFGDRSEVMRRSFQDALSEFEDESLDFVYVDGYAHTGQEAGRTLFDWWPKVRPGGVLSGHDYDVAQYPQTAEAVDRFVAAFGLELFTTRERELRSWLVCKPVVTDANRTSQGRELRPVHSLAVPSFREALQ